MPSLAVNKPMKRLLFLLLVFPGLLAFSQKITVSGILTDVETGEFLIGASVYETVNYSGTTTNNYGFCTENPAKMAAVHAIRWVDRETYAIALLIL